MAEQLGGRVDQGRAAQAGRRHVADDVDPQRGRRPDDFFDGPGRAAHAVHDAWRPRRPGRRRSRRPRVAPRTTSTISPLVPMSTKSVGCWASASPVASTPATVSPPTNPPITGRTQTRPRGWTCRPSSTAGGKQATPGDGHERHFAQRAGVDAAEQLLHGGIAGDSDFIDLLAAARRPLGKARRSFHRRPR